MDLLRSVRRAQSSRHGENPRSLLNVPQANPPQKVHIRQNLAHVRQVRDPAAQLASRPQSPGPVLGRVSERQALQR